MRLLKWGGGPAWAWAMVPSSSQSSSPPTGTPLASMVTHPVGRPAGRPDSGPWSGRRLCPPVRQHHLADDPVARAGLISGAHAQAPSPNSRREHKQRVRPARGSGRGRRWPAPWPTGRRPPRPRRSARNPAPGRRRSHGCGSVSRRPGRSAPAGGFGQRGLMAEQLLAALQERQRRAPRRARAEPGQAREQRDQAFDLGSGGAGHWACGGVRNNPAQVIKMPPSPSMGKGGMGVQPQPGPWRLCSLGPRAT